MFRGGSFDENLIYLNGFENFAARLCSGRGLENQSLVNQDLVKDLSFFGGAFPAVFGDKMASALQINYGRGTGRLFDGILRAGLLSAGLALHHLSDGLSASLAGRWSFQKFSRANSTLQVITVPILKDLQPMVNWIPDRTVTTRFSY